MPFNLQSFSIRFLQDPCSVNDLRNNSLSKCSLAGTILRKLPRKVDVLEGENAAFCVEVEKEEMDIHWYKDGVELRETHQTILKSFGRTHILVFVNTMPQDSGLVIFLVGRSKTSSQLRVKGRNHYEYIIIKLY